MAEMSLHVNNLGLRLIDRLTLVGLRRIDRLTPVGLLTVCLWGLLRIVTTLINRLVGLPTVYLQGLLGIVTNLTLYALPRLLESGNGAGVILIKPRRLEEHDLCNVLPPPSNADVLLERDELARNRDVAELVQVPLDLIVIIPEDELVDELVRVQLQCKLQHVGGTGWGKPPVVIEVNEVIV